MKMRGARHAQISLREALKSNEEINRRLRNEIAPLWDNKEQNKKLTELSVRLVCGKAKVRAYQSALRDVKLYIKAANKAYDLRQKGE